MNERDAQIRARNDELIARFRELDVKEDATAQEWEILAGHYIEAGFYMNASTCFARADKIKEQRLFSTYGRTKAELHKFIAAPWDGQAVEA